MKDKETLISRIILISFLVLIIAMCVAIGISANTSSPKTSVSTEKTTSTTRYKSSTEKSKPALTNSTAQSLVSGYISAYTRSLRDKAYSYDRDIYSVNMVKVASVTVKKVQDSYYGNTNNYRITAKGTFWGYDDYGNVLHKYNYTWEVTIDYYDYSTTKTWMAYHWSDSQITISESY